MLEKADLKKRIDKEEYEQRKRELTEKLVRLQQQCIREKFPVVVCVDGWSASGKGTSISKLVKDLDARAFTVYSMNDPTEEECRYPLMKRFWERVGQYGTMTFFDKSWYSEIIKNLSGMIHSGKGAAHLPQPKIRDHVDYIVKSRNGEAGLFAESAGIFEGQLVADGYLIIKLFFHISKKEQTKRLEALEADKTTAWRVNEEDLYQNKNYDKTLPIIDKLLELTDSADAPWHIIAAENRRVRRIEFLETLVAEIEEGLARHVKIKENPVIIPDDFPLPRTRHDLVEVQAVEEIRHVITIVLYVFRRVL